MSWQVDMKPRIAKDVANRRKTPLEIEDALFALMLDLSSRGPAVQWPNYGKLSQGKGFDRRHCHIRKGRPTWVACWEVDAKNKRIEVYYVGTPEKAPY